MTTGWLDDTAVLVTGGGSGIGRAVVDRFVEEGASVGVLDVESERLAAIDDAHGARVETVEGDVTTLSDNERAVTRTVEAFGGLDVFVGNAGRFDGNVTLPELSDVESEFHHLFDVNVLGYILGAKAALPELLETNGRMVFTASGASFDPDGGGVLYVPSKHAVAGLIRQLAFELAPAISVNGVAPGYVPTNLSTVGSIDRSDTGSEDGFDPSVHPLDIVPQPADYTGTYVLLASEDDSRPMTGTIITADLGRSVRGIGDVAGRALEYITDDLEEME
ncbi:SDR family NAD(P)-dependent oxidoreductase [Halocatena salina]|uniref:SDR family NAD(P)-dependent oxidoreductase n=1 Tax=Halocatena salina TaxID=2934340 RepID=A0A8U0A5M1_9EURY|nr:SDR family NAD(P)-dependent oxidoreductase [Halocatena salina]UPM44334.1 SDR family NAD(P)-dependent oxidoreductase [Halocatena salina]